MRPLGLCAIFVLLPALVLICCGHAEAEEPWRLRLLDDKGFDDPDNIGVGRIFAHDECLYLGTWNAVVGCKMYRSKDGEHWQRISKGGLDGNKNSFVVVSTAWFRDHLYVGTWNEKDGGCMYRSNADADDPSKVEWETLSTDGNQLSYGSTSKCQGWFSSSAVYPAHIAVYSLKISCAIHSSYPSLKFIKLSV